MANDSNELKNNAPCEEKQETHKLTEEELAQVTGVGSHCGIYLGDGQMTHTPQQV